MKNWHLAVLLLAILSVSLAPLPVQADDTTVLEWSTVEKPGVIGAIVVTPSEVSEIAVTSWGTLYALDSSAASKIYQSVNDGSSWTDITFQLTSAGATLPAEKIAVSPDVAGLIAVVTNGGAEVFLSTDDGASWKNLHVPTITGTIQCIAISKQYTDDDEDISEIAIGTAEWGNTTTTGEVWIFKRGEMWAGWKNQHLTIDSITPHIGGEVSAIAYSPSYLQDKTIIVVASTGSTDVAPAYANKTWLCLGYRDTDSNTTRWNSDYGDYSGYPLEVGTITSPSLGDAVALTKISSYIALPSNFSGGDAATRKLFVCYDRIPIDANDDVYRFEDTTVTRLNVNGGTVINLSSLSYHGTISAGKLLTGDVAKQILTQTVQVRRCNNPWYILPAWSTASSPPSGPGDAKVAWSSNGALAYCGTGQLPGVALDESAFSTSDDGGESWQQQSLMDLTLTLCDLAPTPDSQTLFIATYSANGTEGVWRSTVTSKGLGTFWTRQLKIDTASDQVILRQSPDYTDDSTIYAVEVLGDLLFVSHSRGNYWREYRTPAAVIDTVAAGTTTLYVASTAGDVYWTNDSGLTWSAPTATGITNINMITVAPNSDVFVGGVNGEVAYSTDGGNSFRKTYTSLAVGGVQVIADTNYAENGIIYAASSAADSGVWRWQIGLSDHWVQIDKTITNLGAGQSVSGFAMSAEGALYVLGSEPGGGMTRSLDPTASEGINTPEWDVADQELPTDVTFAPAVIFSTTVPYLKFSVEGGQNELWSIDTAHDTIYRYEDTLATNPPPQIIPKNKYLNNTNALNGRAYDVLFSWERPSLNVTDYEIGVYADAACAELIQLCPVADTGEKPNVVIGPYQPFASHQYIEYTPGATYYWRVRVTAPIKSPWSAVYSFTIAQLREIVPLLYSPGNGAADSSQTPAFSWSPMTNVEQYLFMLADNAALDSPLVVATVNGTGYSVTEKLEYGKTYYWEVRAYAPAFSNWSTIASFTVQAKPTAAVPPVITTEAATTPVFTITYLPEQDLTVSLQPLTYEVPMSTWIIIGIYSLLVISIIILTVRTGS